MFNEESGLLLQFLVALGIVLILILLLAWILKKVNTLSSRVGREGADPRLSVREAIQVDHKRRLVLIRRDNVEHLVLIGGDNDLLVEHHIPPLAHAQQQPGPMMRPAPVRPGPAEQTVAPGVVAPAGALPAMAAEPKPMPPTHGTSMADAPQAHSDDFALKAAVSDLTAQPAARPAPAAKPAPNFADRHPPSPSAKDKPDMRMGTTHKDPMLSHPQHAQPHHSPLDPSARIEPKTEFGTTPPRPDRLQPTHNRPLPETAPVKRATAPEGDDRSKRQIEDRDPASPSMSADTASSRPKPSESPEASRPKDDGKSTPTQAAPTEARPAQPAPHPSGASAGASKGPAFRSGSEQGDAPSVEVTPDEAPTKASPKPETPEAQEPESYEDEINRLLNELTNDPKKS